ncbi:MAG: hypothetical protein PUC98_06300 [Clostridiales bacterium]|nr:hypothetical protein [Clostridiales bacterium]
MMESKQKRRGLMWKSLLFYLTAAVLSVAAVSGTLAWLSYIRQLQTATLIDVPEIYIEGPDGGSSELLELGDIDVTKDVKHKEYVFRIVAASKSGYKLQFAYTTNVPFTYTIYKASENNSDGALSVTVGNKSFYYSEKLKGNTYRNDNTHDLTYGSIKKERVHRDAKPKYWQSEYIWQEETLAYYVLSVSWDEWNNGSLKNNKETDMVYLTVKTGTG